MSQITSGEFAGKQVTLILSGTNPGGYTLIPTEAAAEDQHLRVKFDGPVLFNGKELRVKISPSSVNVSVTTGAHKAKNRLTVIGADKFERTVDVPVEVADAFGFKNNSDFLIDNFPFDVTDPNSGRAPAPLKMNTAIVYVTAKSATEIHGMNIERIERSGFISHQTLPGVRVSLSNQNNFCFDVMMSAGGVRRLKEVLNTAVVECDCQTIVLMVDEAHVGIGENHQLSQVLDSLNFSSKGGGSITVAGREVSLKISATTATPTQRISQIFGKRPITHIMAESPEAYYGVDKLLASDRLIDVEKNISAAKLAEALKAHPGFKPQGVIVLRLPSKTRKDDKFASELSAALGGGHLIKTFDAHSKNLSEFSKFVSDGIVARVGRSAIALLKDGFSAGFTLSSTSKIAAWIDLHYADFEPLCQSVGRVFGYGKDGDTFPVVTFREQLEMYQNILAAHRVGVIPSVNTVRTSEKRAAAKLRHHCADKAKYVVGTLEEFKADFERRAEFWPAELVEKTTNSNSVNHIVSWTQENIADKFLRPTNIIYARGFDLSVMENDDGRELTKDLCPKWFKPDASMPDGFKPIDTVKTPEANFNSFRKLRKQYRADIAAGRTIIWLSAADNVIVSKDKANDSVRGRAGNTGLQTAEGKHADPKKAIAVQEAVENPFFQGVSPAWITKIVREIQAELNEGYEICNYSDRIFDTAVEPTAKMLSAMLYGEDASILLTAEMQSGKTGIMILFMHCLPRVVSAIATNQH